MVAESFVRDHPSPTIQLIFLHAAVAGVSEIFTVPRSCLGLLPGLVSFAVQAEILAGTALHTKSTGMGDV